MSEETIIRAITVTAELTQTQLSGTAMAAMAQDLMAEFSEPIILSAFARCRRELSGRLTLSAVIDRAQSVDSRPTANEAWSIAMSCFDESATVVTNDEISEAMGVARPIMQSGDDVGARMAFRDAYDRIVRQARERGVMRPNWYPSLGNDPAGREMVIRQAVDRGLLTEARATAYLPAPISAEDAARGRVIAGLLTGEITTIPNDPQFRKRIDNLMAVLAPKGKAA